MRKNFTPSLKRPLDDEAITIDNNMPISNKTEEEQSSNNNQNSKVDEQSPEDSIAQKQNREFRDRLDSAGKIILDLKKKLEDQANAYQEQLEQKNHQIHNLQVSNDNLQVASQNLKKEMADEDARAARIAATDILQEATALKTGIIQKAHDEAKSYRDKTVNDAESQAHKIKHEADQYVDEANHRVTDCNSQYNNIMQQLKGIAASLQETMANYDDMPANKVAESKKTESNDVAKSVKASQQDDNELEHTAKQFANSTTTKNDKDIISSQKSTEIISKSATAPSIHNEHAVVHQLISNTDDLNADAKSNSQSIARFDDILKQVDIDNNMNINNG